MERVVAYPNASSLALYTILQPRCVAGDCRLEARGQFLHGQFLHGQKVHGQKLHRLARNCTPLKLLPILIKLELERTTAKSSTRD